MTALWFVLRGAAIVLFLAALAFGLLALWNVIGWYLNEGDVAKRLGIRYLAWLLAAVLSLGAGVGAAVYGDHIRSAVSVQEETTRGGADSGS